VNFYRHLSVRDVLVKIDSVASDFDTFDLLVCILVSDFAARLKLAFIEVN